MGYLRFVGSWKLQVSFAKEPYKTPTSPAFGVNIELLLTKFDRILVLTFENFASMLVALVVSAKMQRISYRSWWLFCGKRPVTYPIHLCGAFDGSAKYMILIFNHMCVENF